MNRARALAGLSVLVAVAIGAIAGCLLEANYDGFAPLGEGGFGAAGSGTGGNPSVCGNGKLEMEEACDDGNNAAGDGCAACVIEDCFTCTANAGEISTCTPLAPNSPCQGTKVCDDMKKCVECNTDAQCEMNEHCFNATCFSCNDNAKNGDETDIDCGGVNCQPCGKGKTCFAGTDCATGFCADGVCCDTACDNACETCDLAGFIGECSFISKYGEDPFYNNGEACLATEGEACTGQASCLKAIGQPCGANTECASGRCVVPSGGGGKICLKPMGDPCANAVECVSGNCTNGTCQ